MIIFSESDPTYEEGKFYVTERKFKELYSDWQIIKFEKYDDLKDFDPEWFLDSILE